MAEVYPAPPAQSPGKKGRNWKLIGAIIGGTVVLMCVCLGGITNYGMRINAERTATAQAFMLANAPTPTIEPTDAPTVEPTVGSTPIPIPTNIPPTDTPAPVPTVAPPTDVPPTTEPTPIPEPTTPPDPGAAMTIAIREAYGSPQPGRPEVEVVEAEPGIIVVTFPVKDNFTAGMRRGGMLTAMVDIAEAAFNSPYDLQQLTMVGMFPLVDQYGNTSDGRVAMITLTREVADKINWAGFDRDNLFRVGEDPFLHPEFRE